MASEEDDASLVLLFELMSSEFAVKDGVASARPTLLGICAVRDENRYLPSEPVE